MHSNTELHDAGQWCKASYPPCCLLVTRAGILHRLTKSLFHNPLILKVQLMF